MAGGDGNVVPHVTVAVVDDNYVADDNYVGWMGQRLSAV